MVIAVNGMDRLDLPCFGGADRLFCYGAHRLWFGTGYCLDSGTVLQRWLFGIPIAAFGVYLGNHIARFVPMKAMRIGMGSLLVLSGLPLTKHLWL